MCLDGQTRRVDATKVDRLNSGYELERRLRRPEFEALAHLFQLANLADAADFLLKVDPQECPTVRDCYSPQMFRVNAEARTLA
jgi:hypothetical protein